MAPRTTRQRLLTVLVGAVAVGAGILRIAAGAGGPSLSPVVMEGAPVRATVGGRDAVWVLTTHWETTRLGGGRFNSSPTSSSRMHTDLWRIDATTGTLDRRTRLLSEKGGVRMGFRVYGVAGGKLWLWARGLRAVALDDGRTLADSTTFLAAAPALRGTWPRSSDQVRLDADGLVLLAADARAWRMDPATLAITETRAVGAFQDAYADQFEKRDRAADSLAGVVRPGITYPASTTSFLANNLWERDRWTALATDGKGDSLREPVAGRGPGAIRADGYNARDLISDFYIPPRDRVRLWRARLVRGLPGAWAEGRELLRDVAPLPNGATFLAGGLLTDARIAPGEYRAVPLRLRDPDGVLVLHRTRLDEADTLRLTRADLADGRPRWSAALPLTLVRTVMPGTRTLALYGARTRPRAAGDTRGDPDGETSEVLVLVELATGRVRAWDMDVEGRSALLAAR